MKTRVLPIVGLLTFVAVFAALSIPVPASSAEAEAGGITVQGTASVAAVPDRAELSFGVESQGRTAKAALAANAAEMRRVIAAVKAAGGTGVTTQSVSLSPRYDEQNQVQGFLATNAVAATIEEIAKAGTLIDAAVEAGANQVYGPSLALSDQRERYRDALEAAVADARASAQVLATASSLSLGRITAIVEGGGSAPQPYAVAGKAMDVGSTPIEPGTQRVTAVVSVTFSVS